MSETVSAAGDTPIRSSDLAVAAFVAEQLGCEVTNVTRERAFATNAVYKVEANGRRVVVKVSGQHGAILAEAWSCARGASVGCAAPAVLASGRLGGALEMSAFIMKQVAGSPIGGPHPALGEVGRRLRRLHEVKVPRFGWLAEASWGDADPFSLRHDSWLGFLRDIIDRVGRLAASYSVAAPLATEMAALLDRHATSLASIKVGALCHGDLKPEHVLVDADRLSGVIDWGDAVVGDPLWDVSRFAHRADESSLLMLLEGLDLDRTAGNELAWKLHLYGVLWQLVDATVDHSLGSRVEGQLGAALADLRCEP